MAMKDISDRQVLLSYMKAWVEKKILGYQDSRHPYDILAAWTG